VQPKPKPELLDDLLVNAGQYENFPMCNMGRLATKNFQAEL
jgi:hypothetical protein